MGMVLPSRYWEPEDDRSDEELMKAWEAEDHDDSEYELPFE